MHLLLLICLSLATLACGADMQRVLGSGSSMGMGGLSNPGSECVTQDEYAYISEELDSRLAGEWRICDWRSANADFSSVGNGTYSIRGTGVKNPGNSTNTATINRLVPADGSPVPSNYFAFAMESCWFEPPPDGKTCQSAIGLYNLLDNEIKFINDDLIDTPSTETLTYPITCKIVDFELPMIPNLGYGGQDSIRCSLQFSARNASVPDLTSTPLTSTQEYYLVRIEDECPCTGSLPENFYTVLVKQPF
jgi:hypothetical protein